MSPVRRVVPAILTNNLADLESMVRQTESFASWAQFDIMDGLFVPPQSIFSSDIATVKPSFGYDAHLMAYHPESFFEGFRLAGARRFTFHYEAIPHAADWASYIKVFGIEAGLALNPETPAMIVTTELAKKVDMILLMSVNPGYYGQPFIPEVLAKARELRQDHPDLIIGIDGGIKAENITDVARAGVNEICVGSAIFGASNPAKAYQQLTALAEEGWREYDKNPLS